ncbi:hypothetical protein MPSEU_000053200 [Mayamaea pseudoterrestris]|nr:hypothetical protein MPSEU_000053200 [Mayamaea pseudoterrestris]
MTSTRSEAIETKDNASGENNLESISCNTSGAAFPAGETASELASASAISTSSNANTNKDAVTLSSATTTESTNAADDIDSSDKGSSSHGYSADGSASDQSSDSGGSAMKKLSVHRLDLSQRESSEDEYDDDYEDFESHAFRKLEKDRRSMRTMDERESLRRMPQCTAAAENGHGDKNQPTSSNDRHRYEYEHAYHQRHVSSSRNDSHVNNDQNDHLYLEHLLRSTKQLFHDHLPWQLPALPQYNGVRLSSIMDPRFSLNMQQAAQTLAQQASMLAEGANVASATQQQQQQSFQHYLRLLEMCHPFYRDPLGQPLVHAPNEGGSEQLSSEGFTSYFTTTHSSNNGSSSDGDKNNQKNNGSNGSPNNKKSNDNDAHNNHHDDDGASSSKNDSMNQQQQATSSDASTRDSMERLEEADLHGQQQALEEQAAVDNMAAAANHDSSMSSESSGSSRVEQRFNTGARMVTESSSGGANTNSASGSTMNNASSTSNLGSSGSNNDKGSSEEGKGTGSSEDVAAKEGDGINDGSDELDRSANEDDVELHNYEAASDQDVVRKEQADMETKGATRERKLQDKKRKRIEMRREYEAQQQSESSASTAPSSRVEDMLRPGRPCTLEQVLQFSKVARILVQSQPPFLVVHTNAAYTRLTGIDSHRIVGKPIRELLSIDVPRGHHKDHDATPSQQQLQQQEGQDTSSISENSRDVERNQKIVCLERLVASSGFGKLHDILVNSASQHLIGSSVTFYQTTNTEENCDRGNGKVTAVSFNGGRSHFVRCTSSIAPVASTFVAEESFVVTDREGAADAHKPKQMRHAAEQDLRSERQPLSMAADSSSQRYSHQTMSAVTHFVIQLCASDGKQHETEQSMSSCSTSVQARLLGLSKSMLKAQRLVTNQEVVGMELGNDEAEGENHSDSTAHTKQALTAVG